MADLEPLTGPVPEGDDQNAAEGVPPIPWDEEDEE